MSGHSKWSQIRRQKGVTDAKRGQLFTKLGREITLAARQGGGNPDGNFRLRLAMQKAKEFNMPMENVKRAIDKGTGKAEGMVIDEMMYEGYGPAGVAVLVEVATDNRNRIAAELRNIFTRNSGNMGEAGCVGWLFEPKGLITVEAGKADPDELALVAIDAGADDVKVQDGVVEVYTEPSALERVREALVAKKLNVTAAERTMLPKTTVALSDSDALKTLRLMDRLEEYDDVQKVHVNAEFSDEVLEKYEG
jgi:YebC/PmpR family DNA-binding regulatory protein